MPQTAVGGKPIRLLMRFIKLTGSMVARLNCDFAHNDNLQAVSKGLFALFCVDRDL